MGHCTCLELSVLLSMYNMAVSSSSLSLLKHCISSLCHPFSPKLHLLGLYGDAPIIVTSLEWRELWLLLGNKSWYYLLSMVEWGSKVTASEEGWSHFCGSATPVSNIVSIDCDWGKGRGRCGTLEVLPALVRDVVGGVIATCWLDVLDWLRRICRERENEAITLWCTMMHYDTCTCTLNMYDTVLL